MNVAAAGSNFGTAAGGTGTLQSISGLIGSGGGGPVPKPAAANRRPAASRPSNGAAAAAEGVSSESPMLVFALPCDDDSDSSGSNFT
jgi:hypothetical protein